MTHISAMPDSDAAPLVLQCVIKFYLENSHVHPITDETHRNEPRCARARNEITRTNDTASHALRRFLSSTEGEAILDRYPVSSLVFAQVSESEETCGSTRCGDTFSSDNARAYALPIDDIVTIHADYVADDRSGSTAKSEIRLVCAHSTICGVVRQVVLHLNTTSRRGHNLGHEQERRTARDVFLRELVERHARARALCSLSRFISQSRTESRVHSAVDGCADTAAGSTQRCDAVVVATARTSRMGECTTTNGTIVPIRALPGATHNSLDCSARPAEHETSQTSFGAASDGMQGILDSNSAGPPSWFPEPPRYFVLTHNRETTRRQNEKYVSERRDEVDHTQRQPSSESFSSLCAGSSTADAPVSPGLSSLYDPAHDGEPRMTVRRTRGSCIEGRFAARVGARRNKQRIRRLTRGYLVHQLIQRTATLNATRRELRALRSAWQEQREGAAQHLAQTLARFPALTDDQRQLIDFDALLEPVPSTESSMHKERSEEPVSAGSSSRAMRAATRAQKCQDDADSMDSYSFVTTRESSLSSSNFDDKAPNNGGNTVRDGGANSNAYRFASKTKPAHAMYHTARARAVRLAVLSLVNKSLASHSSSSLSAATAKHALQQDTTTTCHATRNDDAGELCRDNCPKQRSNMRVPPSSTLHVHAPHELCTEQPCGNVLTYVNISTRRLRPISATIRNTSMHSYSSSSSRSSSVDHVVDANSSNGCRVGIDDCHGESHAGTTMVSLVAKSWQRSPCSERQEQVGAVCHRPSAVLGRSNSSSSSSSDGSSQFGHEGAGLEQHTSIFDSTFDFTYPMHGCAMRAMPSSLSRGYSNVFTMTPSVYESSANGLVNAELFLSHRLNHESSHQQQQQRLNTETSDVNTHEGAEM